MGFELQQDLNFALHVAFMPFNFESMNTLINNKLRDQDPLI
jgi:hypothetical protein